MRSSRTVQADLPLVRHVIQKLSLGGAARALVNFAACMIGYRHEVVSLLPPDPAAERMANLMGIGVLAPATVSEGVHLLAAADVIHVHYWNNPEIVQILWNHIPASRTIIWFQINGRTSPHLAPAWIISRCTIVATSVRQTLALPAFRDVTIGRTAFVLGGADLRRSVISKVTSHPFTIGYIGTVDFAKLHPGFVEMCASVGEARFIVCGEGPAAGFVKASASRAGLEGSFDFRGYVSDLGAVLGEMDVFGYPLADTNYGASELVLQEVMAAGIPPVVLSATSPCELVIDGVTGLIATGPDHYVASLQRLRDDRNLRLRLGESAAAYAANFFGADRTAAGFAALYESILQIPPTDDERGLNDTDASLAGSDYFILALGDDGTPFRHCKDLMDEDGADQMGVLAQPNAAMLNVLIQYRHCFPQDGWLAFWLSLQLKACGRAILALPEAIKATTLGCTHPRLAVHTQELAIQLRATRATSRAIQNLVTSHSISANGE